MDEFWNVLMDNMDATLMIFARVLGIFSFNPILSRGNVPGRVRAGGALFITYVIAMTINVGELQIGDTAGEYVLCIIRELSVGLILGFICDMFVYLIFFAGEIMDSQAGLGMAKIFDPSSHMQMSLYGSYIGYMFYLYFFVSDSHLTLIKIFVDSFETIPLCTGFASYNFGWTAVEMFAGIVTLMVQLAMPIMAAELIVEFSVGIMMKAVPQIQIMAVNIQLKVLVGFAVLFAITPALSEFITSYMDNMLETCKNALPIIWDLEARG